MKKNIFIMVILLHFNNCFGEPTFASSIIVNNIGFQQGFGFNTPILRPSVDFNVFFNYIINGGVNYQFNYGWNAYAGLGIASFLELQYGYAFSAEKHLLRIRTDVVLDMWFADWFEGRHSHPLAAVMLGFYIEHAFKYSQRGTTIGITISYPIMVIYPDKKGTQIIPGWNI
jgi:hypothetical protein